MTIDWEDVSPEQVLKFEKPCQGFLCPLAANTYGVEFLKFEIRDLDSGTPVFISADAPCDMPNLIDEDLMRTVKYSLPSDFLRFETVRTMLEFRVGAQPVENFRMIELHYFKNRLVRLYDFTFGFCIPNSVNTWEAIYDVPVLEPGQVQEYIESPFEHTSDSFYFNQGKLIMHNKATFQYVP